MGDKCGICGRDTETTDWEYLIGNNHIGCVLSWDSEVSIHFPPIRGWGKLEGMKIGEWVIHNPKTEVRKEGKRIETIGYSMEIRKGNLTQKVTLFREGKWEIGGKPKYLLLKDIQSPEALIERIRNEI